ncbi:acetyltransferase [Cytobacillus horneckiae]|uniref:acetyltransferase n=1 Tax=Cytobacillus horneckiae TaxID=549687 RepID=UPI003D1CAA44
MNVAIIGRGGHSKVIEDLIASNENMKIIGYFDDKYRSLKLHDDYCLAPIDYLKDIFHMQEDLKIIIAIGNNRVRKQIFERLHLPLESFATIIHPSACVSPSATIGCGTVVMPRAVINADSVIGIHAIINTGAIIEHDNHIGDYVHISPNSTLTGMVKVYEGAHVGSASVVIPKVEIGQWSVIGAGSTVIHSLPSKVMAVGLPARTKKILEWSEYNEK